MLPASIQNAPKAGVKALVGGKPVVVGARTRNYEYLKKILCVGSHLYFLCGITFIF